MRGWVVLATAVVVICTASSIIEAIALVLAVIVGGSQAWALGYEEGEDDAWAEIDAEDEEALAANQNEEPRA